MARKEFGNAPTGFDPLLGRKEAAW
jgi:hypothetical protein